LTKLLPYILFEYIYFKNTSENYMHILALEMASTGNQHCANCIGTLSFPVAISLLISHSQRGVGKSELQQQA